MLLLLLAAASALDCAALAGQYTAGTAHYTVLPVPGLANTFDIVDTAPIYRFVCRTAAVELAKVGRKSTLALPATFNETHVDAAAGSAAFVATAASLRYVDGDRVVLDLARAPATPVEDALAVLGLCATLGLRHATDAQGRSPCCGGGT